MGRSFWPNRASSSFRDKSVPILKAQRPWLPMLAEILGEHGKPYLVTLLCRGCFGRHHGSFIDVKQRLQRQRWPLFLRPHSKFEREHIGLRLRCLTIGGAERKALTLRSSGCVLVELDIESLVATVVGPNARLAPLSGAIAPTPAWVSCWSCDLSC